MTQTKLPIEQPVWRFTAALACSLTLLAAGWALSSWLGVSPQAILLLGVVAAAWLGGFGAALSATFLTAAGSFLLPWPSVDDISRAAWLVNLLSYIAAGVAVAYLAKNIRRAKQEVENAANRKLAALMPTDSQLRHLLSSAEARDNSERDYAALVEAVPQIVWTSTPAGDIDFANKRWYEASGFTYEQTMGNGWIAAVHPDDLPGTIKRWMQALETGEPVDVSWRLRMHDGSYRWQLERGIPVREGNRVVKWFGTLTDIENQKQAEEVLHEAARRKDEFLATLSHELRNPLAPIRNMLEVLKRDGEYNKSNAQAIAVMDRQLRQLVRLIDDLLDVSRIGQGRIEIRPQRVALSAVIGQAVEASRALAELQQHKCEVILPDRPVTLYGDPARLAQVFDNLLINSCRYTPPGGSIRLEATVVSDTVTVSVRDNGIGIAPHMHSEIFKMFSQAEASTDQPREGLGIGLTLVRRFVEMHHGTVEARSEGLGKGSEFVVRLPIVVADAEPPQPVLPAVPLDAMGVRILVVDDNADAASSLAALLEGYGYEVRQASRGDRAIEIASEWLPRVLFCDLSMPGMHGTEVARRLRQESAHDRTILVALTGYGSQEDRIQTRHAGFDHHLVKPIDPNLLQEILIEAANDPTPTDVALKGD